MILAGMIHEEGKAAVVIVNKWDALEKEIRQKLEGLKASPDTIIMAKIYDLVNLLLWSKTKDAEKGRNQPKSFAKLFLVSDEPEPASFASGAEYEKARAELVKKIKGAG